MRKMLAMMMENKAEVIYGVPPIMTNKKKLLRLKAFGGTEQNGTPTPDAPVDIVSNNGVLKVNSQGQIYTDGTVETINVHSKNLFNKNTITLDRTITVDGLVTQSTGNAYSDFIPVAYGKTYYIGARGLAGVAQYNSSKDFISRISVSYGGGTYTPESGISYIRVNLNQSSADTLQIEEGTTATPYEPYY
jgi:hypothetical protein